MAYGETNPVKELQDELTCPICLDNFKDPVSIQCGHNFCRRCISQTWKGIYTNFSCPQCRKISKWKFLRPNRIVENVMEISAQLLAAKEGEEEKKQCLKHDEPLKLFCKDDYEEICVVCRESVYHRNHTVVPVEETTEDFEVEVEGHLRALRKEISNVMQLKTVEEEKAQALEAEILQKRKSMAAGFECLRQLLADEETTTNHRLDNLQRTIQTTRNECIGRLDDQLSCLQKGVTDLEKSLAVSHSHIHETQEAAANRHSDVPHPKSRKPRPHEIEKLESFRTFAVCLSLDLKTANPNLLVSCRNKCVRYQEEALTVAPRPERFDSKPCVLATTGFRLGKHYWEVDVGGGIYWTIGIAKQSVCRKGFFRIEPGRGIWAIGLLGMNILHGRVEYHTFHRIYSPRTDR
ncbi:E3 ubiquitin-protein ligase TRIM39-like [Leptodactylus fuscus]